jgi:hypothetical protein
MTHQPWLRNNTVKSVIAVAIFVCCVAPTFISYQPYVFRWDDADYMRRAVQVGRSFWLGDLHRVLPAMVGPRPPAMTLLGLPWGLLQSWESIGSCFISLGAAISLLAAVCLYLLLRLGIKPLYLALASVCVFASLGPLPAGSSVHQVAAGFMADSLLAWTALAALFLIPYEARRQDSTIRESALSGIVWGLLFSLGLMAKLSFVYFAVLIIPILLFIKLWHSGWRSMLAAAISLLCFSMPSILYMVRWGRPAYKLARGSSFGRLANSYYVPLSQFVANVVRESPGLLLSFFLIAAGLIFVLRRARFSHQWAYFLVLVIIVGYAIIIFASPNREIRFAFSVIIALPFLTATLLSDEAKPLPPRFPVVAAAVAFCCLSAASLPMYRRPDKRSISRSAAVLDTTAQFPAKSIVLATDSPTLNDPLLLLAREFSAAQISSSATMAYRAVSRTSIEDDFRLLSTFDMVVIQDREALSPAFTNQRVSDYERYVRQVGSGPVRVADDTSVYLIHH